MQTILPQAVLHVVKSNDQSLFLALIEVALYNESNVPNVYSQKKGRHETTFQAKNATVTEISRLNHR
jgi:hypothetical protein